MANTKLDRIERDIEKTRAKILEYQKRLKDLEAQKIEEENAQIVQMVKAVHLDGAQLAAFLSAQRYRFACRPCTHGRLFCYRFCGRR